MTDKPTDQPDAALEDKIAHFLHQNATKASTTSWTSRDEARQIMQLIQADRERLAGELEALKQDEHPMEDGVAVETYGYEAQYNLALADAIRLVRGGGK